MEGMIIIEKNLKELAKLAFCFIPISFLLSFIGPCLHYFNRNTLFFSSTIWMKSVTIFMVSMLFCGISFSAIAERIKK